MKKLTLNEDMNPKYEVPARLVFEEINNSFDEVCATKGYIRVRVKKGYSIYFWPKKDNNVLVDIEGKSAVGSFLGFAEMYWGEYRNKVVGKNIEYYYWVVDATLFYQTISNVMTRMELTDTDAKLIEDVDFIYNKKLPIYEKKALAKQRIGHSSFALKVKKRVNNTCILDARKKRNLIASHIKPWAESVDEEKIDVANGLCLSPDYDGLFEDGLISFTSEGKILTGKLSVEEMLAYGLTGFEMISVAPNQGKYLKWHVQNKYHDTRG